MRLILCGGGSGEKTILANKIFSEIIDSRRSLLYVPLAMESERYPSCLEWITNELESVGLSRIDMISSSEELSNKRLDEYSAIFIGGGNTYKLLSELKQTKAFENIKEYIENGGIVYGGSAGAIIMGYTIDACEYMDPNVVNLGETQGFNTLNGYSLTAHYTNKSEEKTKIATDYLIEFSRKNNPVIALPEEDSAFVNNDEITIIGTKPYYIFDNGEAKKYEANEKLTKEDRTQVS